MKIDIYTHFILPRYKQAAGHTDPMHRRIALVQKSRNHVMNAVMTEDYTSLIEPVRNKRTFEDVSDRPKEPMSGVFSIAPLINLILTLYPVQISADSLKRKPNSRHCCPSPNSDIEHERWSV